LQACAGAHQERIDGNNELGGHDVLAMASESRPTVRPHLAELLAVAQIGGAAAAEAGLHARGVEWRLAITDGGDTTRRSALAVSAIHSRPLATGGVEK
jgi:hypothetical protein